MAGQIWQTFTRGNWEVVHQQVANYIAHFQNREGKVENVKGFYGATVINLNSDPGYAYNIGSYITGDFDDLSIPRDRQNIQSSTLIHEYGHYLQGRAWGTFPYIIGGLNSKNFNAEIDERAWSERDASLRGMEYFSKKGFSMNGYGDPNIWPEDLPRNKAHLGWINAIIVTGIIGAFFIW